MSPTAGRHAPAGAVPGGHPCPEAGASLHPAAELGHRARGMGARSPQRRRRMGPGGRGHRRRHAARGPRGTGRRGVARPAPSGGLPHRRHRRHACRAGVRGDHPGGGPTVAPVGSRGLRGAGARHDGRRARHGDPGPRRTRGAPRGRRGRVQRGSLRLAVVVPADRGPAARGAPRRAAPRRAAVVAAASRRRERLEHPTGVDRRGRAPGRAPHRPGRQPAPGALARHRPCRRS